MSTDAPGKFYVYAVIDADKALVDVRLTRQEGRTVVRELGRPELRVRRGKLTLFET